MKKSVYKILINWYQASDKELPAWLQRACASDASLAGERDFGDELTQALKKRPNDTTPIAGDSMTARVMRQITEEDYNAHQESTKSSLWGSWVRNAGYGVAAVAVVALSIQFMDTSNPSQPDVTSPGEVAKIDSGLAIDVGEELIEAGEDWRNPLDQEIEYIVSDAKGAIGFLANSFVPSNMLKRSGGNSNA